ncbi:MAG: tripartite tricarboxylate transporter substrate binding protein [Proteobacteria bacterium]|nr:tripartite tricarboxylate transporter substrate binding protein [Pseudomonadota bacterium]
MRRLSLAAITFLVGAIALIGLSQASFAFPDRPIRLIVVFPPGGSSDSMARIVQNFVETKLGQPVIIENRPGAGGVVGLEVVKKAAPDGYTVAMAGAGALVTDIGARQASYDPRHDFTPITGIASSPFLLAAAKSFGGKTLKDVINIGKKPGGSLIAHGGNGTLMHLTAEMLNQKAGTHFDLVPYRGMAPVLTDLMGGHVPLGILDPPSAKAAIDAGQINVIAITSKGRFSILPNIPTMSEAGLPGFEATGWFGIVAPRGIPDDVAAKLNAAFVAALMDPGIAEKIRALGSEPMPMTSAEFRTFIDTEIQKWSAVSKAAPPPKPK